MDWIGTGYSAEQAGIWIAHGLGDFDQVDRLQCRIDQPHIARDAMQAKPDQRHLAIAGQTCIVAAPPPVAADQSGQNPRQLQAARQPLGRRSHRGNTVTAAQRFGGR